MTNVEFREAIAALGLSQRRAAKLLGVDERTSRKWASGETAISPPAERFLLYLIAVGVSGDEAMRIIAKA
jgi:transcriptional regulator with XRE-family HTH domain